MQPVRTAFRSLARLRHAPAFHPTGTLYDGEAVIDGTGPLPPGTWPALIRFSKGIGTPAGLPDFIGIAVRLDHPDGPVDVLCTSALGTTGWRRFALFPAQEWGHASLSSLMILERGNQRVTVGAELADPRLDSADPDVFADALPVRLSLSVTASSGATLQTGDLTVATVSGRSEDDAAFDPDLHAPPGWSLGPRWLARVREAAYVGSRRGRHAHDTTVQR
jgi:hypothetical protein